MIYFDNAATTPLFPELKEIIFKHLDIFANPSSIYTIAHQSQDFINATKKEISSLIVDSKPENIIFTSGGTESNNLAILGYLKKHHFKHNIGITKIEHKSITKIFENNENLKNIRFFIPFDNNVVDIDSWIKTIKEHNIKMISISHIYSETSNRLNILEISSKLKKEFPYIYIHIDAVQSFLKYDIDYFKYVDSISISAHKLHSLKGCGVLILKNYQKISPILEGTQNGGLRGGTENLTSILTLGSSIKIWNKNFTPFRLQIEKLNRYFYHKLDDFIKKYPNIIKISKNNKQYSDSIITIAIKNIYSEHIIHYLESEKIFISAGSACNSKKLPSFLKLFKIKKEFHNGVLRISFSSQNNISEIDTFFIHFEKAINYFS